MVRLRFLGYLFLTSLICVLLGSAPIRAEKLEFRVKLDIANYSSNKNLAEELRSYISRELRSLGDVLIVNEDPDYELIILSMDAKTGGESVGYVISGLILQTFDIEGFVMTASLFISDEKAKEALKESLLKSFDLWTNNIYENPSNLVRTTPIDGLKSACQKIVTDFDTDYLERGREIHRYFEETRKKPKKEPRQK